LKKMQHKLMIIFAIVLTSTLVLVAVTASSPPKTMSSQPQAELYVGSSADPNVYDPVNIKSDKFTVYIKGRNIIDLWGASLWMNYNFTVLNCTAVRYGSDWGTPFVDYVLVEGTINRTKGSIEEYDAFRMDAALPKNATLYEVDFHMLNWEGSVLQISGTPTELLNRSVSLIDVLMTDGYFVPEFPLATILPLLIIVTLAAFSLRKGVSVNKRIGPSPAKH